MSKNNNKKEVNKLAIVGVIAAIAFITLISVVAANGGFAGLRRSLVDFKSDISGGLNREINVYTANGDLIAHYEGKIDIQSGGDSQVKFDLDGKRYIYYNCFVETIADI